MKKLMASLSRQNVVLIIIAVVVVAIVIASFLVHPKPASAPAPAGVQAGQPASLSDADMKADLAKLAALTTLPKDETPVTQVLANTDALKKSQPFLERAADGDVLFLYVNAEIAILYRPSTNTIVATGPLHKGPPPSSAGSIPPPAAAGASGGG